MATQEKKTLTFVLMDAPYENARTTTAFRLLDAAVRRGHDVKVFAYEGAVAHSFARQAPHGNAVHGRNAKEEDHPNPKDWIAALMQAAEAAGATLEWMNCGLCVDERGVGEAIPGVSRGSPADLWKMSEASDNTLVIPTR
ncbi:MAG TPA: DsrE family protein [Kofleriaceae bacterium]|nr:DsrE family protein [Kofleriaceae bacterium]